MIRNYLIMAFRSMFKQRVYTFINVAGLSTGIASCLLITLFVLNEFSYDSFHQDADRIYKVALERKYPTHSTLYAIIPHSFGDVIQSDFPEVEAVVKMAGPFNVGISYKNEKSEEKVFEETRIMSADSNFFHVFNIPIIKGDPGKALVKLTDLVMTEETAKRYFNNDEAIGKTVNFFGNDFTVTAVCANVPDNSHMQFDILFKFDDGFFGARRVNYTSFSSHTYLKLREGVDPAELEAKFPKMVDTYAAAQIETNLGKSWADYKKEGNGYRYFLQPLQRVHLDPQNIEAKVKPGGNRIFVYFLISVAALILVIACINFMNLATARSAERAREVGVRKSLGSAKTQLISQFLTESLLLATISAAISLLIIYVALPSFNEITGKNFSFDFSGTIITGLITITILVGILAGIYPAFFLSSFNTVTVMKGDGMPTGRSGLLRNALVIFQFTISIILIVGTLVVSRQMEFVRNKSLGFNKEETIVIERLFALNDRAQTFLDEVERLPGVSGAAGSFNVPGGGRPNDYFGEQWSVEGSSEILTTKTMTIDDDLIDLVDFELAEGVSFSRETNDSLNLMLNETAVKTFKLTDPVGKKFTQTVIRRDGNIQVTFTIIGVIKDFNFQTLRDAITPLTIRSTESFNRGRFQYAFAKVNTDNFQDVVASIESKWKSIAPEQPFKYFFLDQQLEANYRAEKTSQSIFTTFSALAIIIACIGLFGLAAYTASRRTKEIGIRKVLGASVNSVVFLLSKDFTKLIAFSFILAVPVGWYMMNSWLDNFAYRIQLGAGEFLIAGLMAVAIGWITVSYQSIKAAIMNPINALRNRE